MKKLMLTMLGLIVSASAFAQEGAVQGETKAFQASLTPDIAIQSRDTQVNGFSIGVWNENPGSQCQLGFVNGTTGDSEGLQFFLFYNYAENYKGAQIAVVNYASGDFIGLQWGFVNITGGSFTGLQLGAVNYAETLTGLQLGVVNWATAAKSGVQIGFVNVIEENNWFTDFPQDLAKGMVIVNWGF
jgi:hypothetical protein